MKVRSIREFDNDENTMTLRIIEGETFEGTVVTERLSLDTDPGSDDYGREITHVTLETPTTEEAALRTLEELAIEADGDMEFDI